MWSVILINESKSNVYTTTRSAFLVMRKCDTESEQMSGCVLGGLPVSVCDLFRILISLFTMHNFEVTRIFFPFNGISSRETLVSTRCSQVGPECA